MNFKNGDRVRLWDTGDSTGLAGTIHSKTIHLGMVLYRVLIDGENELKNYYSPNLRKIPKIKDRINCGEIKGMGTLIYLFYNFHFNSYYYSVELDNTDKYGNKIIGLYENHLDENNKVISSK